MINISHQITSIDQFFELFETKKTTLMVGIISLKEVPLKYWVYYGKLEAKCAYYGWASNRKGEVIIQNPGKSSRVSYELIPPRIIGGTHYGCATPVEQIVITSDLFEKTKIYVER